jgi:hypothetical protein
LLGASNLAHGLPLAVGGLSRLWPGDKLEVLAALGYGRSYGATTWMLGRSLPGILPSRLWEALAKGNAPTGEPAPMYGLVTDIGNDIMYGVAPDRIGGWVGEAMLRLAEAGAAIAVTSLPLESVRRLDRRRFTFFRNLFFPRSRLQFEDAIPRAIELDERVREEARRHQATLVPHDPRWYGIDPIHFRISQKRNAWRAILAPFAGGKDLPLAASSPVRWGWLRTRRPNDMQLLGIQAGRKQPCAKLPGGGTLSLY